MKLGMTRRGAFAALIASPIAIVGVTAGQQSATDAAYLESQRLYQETLKAEQQSLLAYQERQRREAAAYEASQERYRASLAGEHANAIEGGATEAIAEIDATDWDITPRGSLYEGVPMSMAWNGVPAIHGVLGTVLPPVSDQERLSIPVYEGEELVTFAHFAASDMPMSGPPPRIQMLPATDTSLDREMV
jgi:hypothetical protein